MVSSDSKWHIDRRIAAQKKHPELKKLNGPFYLSVPILLALVLLQWYFWYRVNELESYALIGLLAWLNATTAFYASGPL